MKKEQSLISFLINTGLKIECVFREAREDKETGNVDFWYRVTMERNGYKFRFNYPHDIKLLPAPLLLFEWLCKEDPGTFTGWCELNGYNEDSRRDKKEWQERLREYTNLTNLFNHRELKELIDITLPE
jgi:hypothetical protein